MQQSIPSRGCSVGRCAPGPELPGLFQPRGKAAPDVDVPGGGVDEGDADEPPARSVAGSGVTEGPFGGGFAFANQDAAEAKFDGVVAGEEGAEEPGDGWSTPQFVGGWL